MFFLINETFHFDYFSVLMTFKIEHETMNDKNRSFSIGCRLETGELVLSAECMPFDMFTFCCCSAATPSNTTTSASFFPLLTFLLKDSLARVAFSRYFLAFFPLHVSLCSRTKKSLDIPAVYQRTVVFVFISRLVVFLVGTILLLPTLSSGCNKVLYFTSLLSTPLLVIELG